MTLGEQWVGAGGRGMEAQQEATAAVRGRPWRPQRGMSQWVTDSIPAGETEVHTGQLMAQGNSDLGDLDLSPHTC